MIFDAGDDATLDAFLGGQFGSDTINAIKAKVCLH
jgi:hypothetical protein